MELSHEVGSADWVLGGGGNVSVKHGDIIYVKPSGIALSEVTCDNLIAVDRKELSHLYVDKAPAEVVKREQWVKDMMASAVMNGGSGRASVEAPLHDSLGGVYVVHTHPAVVNGMTCSDEGSEVCRRLFPDALWIDYTDPGYMLCMRVREEVANYKKRYGSEPKMVLINWIVPGTGSFTIITTPVIYTA